MTQEMNNSLKYSSEIKFNEHFLTKRLARVPKDVLENFVLTWLELDTKKSQKELIYEITLQLGISQNNQDFILAFKNFLRDCVLSARESEYLLKIKNKEKVLAWLNSLANEDKFIGQRYDFIFHTFLEFQEKFLPFTENIEDQSNPISFPTELVLLIAVAKNPILVSNGLEPIYYFPTTEIEILFRGDLELIEVRGEFQVIRDFVNTAVQDQSNPLNVAKSVFVGDKNDSRPNSSLVSPARFIKIDALKESINGSYLSVSASVSGTKTSRVTIEFDGLSNSNEETDIILRPVIEKTIKDPDKTKIAFDYQGKHYAFGITKSGGLTFQKYTPEEVVTYILRKLRDLARS